MTPNIGQWLWYGARVRVTKTITTTGGTEFNEGEILRLDKMQPYGKDTSLCGMWFVSVNDESKSLYCGGEPASFDYLMDASLPSETASIATNSKV